MIEGEQTSHTHVISDKDALDLHRWIAIPRFVTVTVMVSVIVYFWITGKINFDPRPVLFIVVPLFLIATAFITSRVRQGKNPARLLLPQLLLDLAGSTGGIILTGGSHSPFLGLYVLVIVSAGIVSARVAVITGTLVAILYTGLVWVEQFEFMTAFQSDLFMAYSGGAPITFAVFLITIGLIAFQSQFYARQIREKDEALLKIKDEFLFRTTHDLRSPSTVIKLVLEKYNDPKIFKRYPEMKEDVQLVSGAIERMLGLITDLLKIGRGEEASFKVKKDTLDPAGIMESILTELSPVIGKKQVIVSHEKAGSLPIIGDAEKLKEAFNNFIDNGVKYNKDGGTILIQYKKEGRVLATTITDNGIGISTESQAKLFSPYFRGDIGQEIQGTGLGLYTTKRLIEKMDGTITVTSVKGTGSTFVVRLPLA